MSVQLKHPVPDPQPGRLEIEVYQKGVSYHKPPFTFKTDEWEEAAHKVLSANSWGYVYGSAGTGETARKNVDAFRKWSIIGSRMVDEGWPDMSTTVLGQKIPYPIGICPVRVHCSRLLSRSLR